MRKPRPPKKSESLEIRIPYHAKMAFMERCRQDGRSASEALRTFIEQQIEAPPPRGRRWRLVIGAAIAAALGAVALPSLARPADPAHDLLRRVAFAHLDANRDGVVSIDEYLRGRP